MSERKNIDRLFQETFKDFEAEPSEIAWENIEARLEEKKNRKVIPLWFKYAGVAAIFLIGLLLITFNTGKDQFGSGASDATVNAPSDKSSKSPLKNSQNPGNPGDNVNRGLNETGPVNAITVTDDTKSANESGLPQSTKGSAQESQSGGSNASGIRQSNDDIVVYPMNKEQEKNKNGRAGKAGVSNGNASPFDNSREHYASSSKKGKHNKHHNKKTARQANLSDRDIQVAQNAGRANSGTPSETGSRNPQPGKNIEQEFKNENKIAVNENNQSGQPGQHNNQRVTETTTTSTQAIVAKTDDIKLDSTATAMAEKPNALEELQNEKESKSVAENEPKMNRWQVSPRVAPIYLSSSSEGSPIDSRFANNEKDYKTQLSYGLGVSYALNKRLSLRTGVNSLAFEYNTNNVVAKQSSVGRKQLEHVNPTVQGAFLRIENRVEGGPVELANNGLAIKEFSSSLSQKTGYFEIPVELSYKVIDKRFGIDVIGGFSTLLLNENEVLLVSSENQMQVGKANNLNATSFSTNLGIGFRYDIWKSLQVNFEPTFKYQINTYTESGNFKPYFFGLYTGLNYRF